MGQSACTGALMRAGTPAFARPFPSLVHGAILDREQ
jgi:hypothetical protein